MGWRIKLNRKSAGCTFCGKRWFTIRWTAKNGKSLWACLVHTRPALRVLDAG